jgi:hypothetical protein
MRAVRRLVIVLPLVACAPAAPPPPLPPPAVAPSPAPPPRAPAEVSVVAEGWELAFARGYGKTFVYDRLEGAAVVFDGDRFEAVASPFAGLPTAPDSKLEIAGGWPHGAAAYFWSRGSEKQLLFRHTAAGWVPQRGVEGRLKTGALLAGREGRTLGMFERSVPDPQKQGASYTEHVLMALGGEGEATPVATAWNGIGHVTTSIGGEIAALDYKRYGDWQLVRWRPGEAEPTRTDVPEPPAVSPAGFSQVTGCLAPDGAFHLIRTADRGRNAALLTLRGTSWEVIDLPPGLTSYNAPPCAVAGDGSVWMALEYGSALLRRAPDGAIERVPMPNMTPPRQRWKLVRNAKNGWLLDLAIDDAPPPKAPLEPRVRDMFTAPDGTVWISAGRYGGLLGDDLSFDRTMVLRTGKPPAGGPIDWDALAPGRVEARITAYNAARGYRAYTHLAEAPIDDKCRTLFFRLATLPRTTPADHPFPIVRDALKGRAELAGTRIVEAEFDDQRILAALVPSLAAGKALLAALAGKVSTAGARAHCGRPKVTRVIPVGIEGE